MKKKICLILTIIFIATMTGCSLQNDIQPKTKEEVKVTSSIELDDTTPSGNYKVEGVAFFSYERPETITYGQLDSLGRPTYATANITAELYNKEKNEKREPIKVNPVGWPEKNPRVQVNYKDGTSYKGYFWNRSHMIADSLGGEPIVENLITGTRAQNVGTRHNDGGMAYAESKVRKHFDSGNKSTVWYEVINFYNDNELIPRRTLVNMKSDDGSIDERVVVYNTADGYKIDYNTAEVNEE